jgi:hypothetical protein
VVNPAAAYITTAELGVLVPWWCNSFASPSSELLDFEFPVAHFLRISVFGFRVSSSISAGTGFPSHLDTVGAVGYDARRR